MTVLRAGVTLTLPRSRKTRALLAYLVATGRPQRRERLCGMFWDVPDDPRGSLRWSLSKLRAIVDEPDGRARILADRETVAFSREGAECDLFTLRDLVAAGEGGLAAMDTSRLRAAAEGIGGDFLEGLDLAQQPDFQAWCVSQREDSRRQHAALLHALVARLSPDAPDEAVVHARRLVGLDPLDSSAHCALVALLAHLGRRDEAELHRDTGLRLLKEAGMPAGELSRAARNPRVGPSRSRTGRESVAAAAMASPAAPSGMESDPALPPHRIVVVDDEPEIGHVVTSYLARHGFDARAATNGQALDRLLAAEPADLVVLDVNLPGEDGFAIARRLRASGGPPVLFLTAADDVVDRVAGLELGAEDYIVKPFDLRELRARLGVALRRAAAHPRD